MGQGKSIAVDSKNFIVGAPVTAPSSKGASVTGHTVSIDPDSNNVTVRWPDGSTGEYKAKLGGPTELLYAAKGEPLTENNFKANAVCCRGPDWKWGDQDRNGTGRILSLEGKWAKVRWDCDTATENSYRCGAEGKHDLLIFAELTIQPTSPATSGSSIAKSVPILAASSPSSPPMPPVPAASLIPEGCPVHFEGAVIGAKVVRGVDWPAGDNTDSNGEGVLMALEGKKARVKWSTDNVMGTYRAGPDHYDLLYAQATPSPTAVVVGSSSSAIPTTCVTGTAPSAPPGAVVSSSNYVENSLVVRGPDWKWGNQDVSPGKLKGLSKSSNGDWARVTWGDGKSNSYRIGAEGKHDLAFATASSTAASSPITGASSASSPAGVVTKTNFFANASVRRGPDWKWGSQDQNSVGILLSIDGDSWGKVRWPHGVTNSYRAGAEGAHDLEYATGGGATTSAAAATTTAGARSAKTAPSNAINVTNFVAGASVLRGPDWKYGDQDKSGGGKLTSADASGWVRVTWADGTSNSYRSGADSFWDIIYSANPPVKAGSPGGATGIVSAKNLFTNTKVIRGPDWAWGEQDKSGPGTLLSFDAGWGKVKWPDGTSNSYRCGVDSKHDLAYADGSPTAATGGASAATPAGGTTRGPNWTPVSRDNFVPNAPVVRGPDWKWGDQDKNDQGTGVSIDSDNWVRVTWKGGFTNSYRAGVQGAYDLAYPNGPPPRAPATTTPAKKQPVPRPTPTPTPTPTPPGPSPATAAGEPKAGEKVQRSNFKAGATISRGPDWKWGEQDKGGEGKTLSIDSSDWVKVQWSDGTVNSYRGGASGAFDLQYGPKKSLATATTNLPDAKPTDNTDEACVVCLTNVREYCCVPCGHVVLCPACLPDVEAKSKKCPVCREPYQMLMRVFK